MTNIVEILRQRAAGAPGAPFVKCAGPWLAADEFDAITDRVAAGLRAAGVERGDRVALIVPNRQEMLELFFACAKLGAIQVPLNYWLKGEFLRFQLADCGAKVLVADDLGIRSAGPILTGTAVQRVVHLDPDPPALSCPSLAYGELRSAGGPAPSETIHDRDVQSILYTSGTSGPPKGCMLPYGYYPAAGAALGAAELVVPGDRVFTAFPLFHAGGQAISLTAALVNGASIEFETEFSASQFMPRATAAGATMIWGVGPMGMAILAQPPTPADREHALRLASWVPMAPVHQLGFEERFGVPVTAEMYGQTECQPITVSPVSGPRNRASAGLPSPHLEVQLVDDDDRPVATGEIGEIVVRPNAADTMLVGYWGRPEATLESRRNLWHHTGDYGRADAEGFIAFVDRKKDALRRRGENVSSFELEAAIRRHESVREVAVCAVPSPLGEDDIKACIVCHDNADLSPDELFAFFRDNLPYFAIPRYVELRSALPVTAATGRVMKHQLRDEGVTDATWDLEQLGLVVAKADRRG